MPPPDLYRPVAAPAGRPRWGRMDGWGVPHGLVRPPGSAVQPGGCPPPGTLGARGAVRSPVDCIGVAGGSGQQGRPPDAGSGVKRARDGRDGVRIQ